MALASDYGPDRPWPHRRRRFTPKHLRSTERFEQRTARRHAPDDPLLIAPRLMRAAALLRAAQVAAARRCETDPATAELLLAFTEVTWSQRPTDIARRTAQSRSAVSRALARAEAQRLIDRRPHLESDREISVTLTARGRMLLGALQHAWLDELDRCCLPESATPLGEGLRRLVDVGGALRRFELQVAPPFDPFQHAPTSSKWRTARWAATIEEYPE